MPKITNPALLIGMSERDTRIIELRRSGMHWKDIATEVGLSMARCHQICDHYRKDIPQNLAAAWREEELDLLGQGIHDLRQRLARDPGMSANAQALIWGEICKLSESRRKLTGIDAPTKREVEIVDTTSWEAEARMAIAETERELRAARALAEQD